MRRIIPFLILTASVHAAMDMQIVEPPADSSSFGRIMAVSSDGSHMAGEAVVLIGLQREAVKWNVTGGMSLAAVSVADPAAEIASGVSDDGTVVAGWHVTTRSTGFVLVEGETAPTLVNNQEYRIHALSSDGSTAVGCDAVDANSFDFNAATWNLASGVRTVIADLAGGTTEAAFLAISSDKGTCVGYGESSSGRLAVRSTGGGALVSLGELPGGHAFSEARGVSGDGSVVVGRSVSASGMEACRWTGGGIEGLGDLPGGAFVSEACSVSDDGQVIVGVAESELGGEVFVWLEGRGMRSLRTVAKAGGIDLDGWHFSGSWPVISGDGNVLALNAIDPGQAPRFLRLSGLRTAAAGQNPLPTTVCGLVGGSFRMEFHAEPALRYQLECSTTLASGDWEGIGDPVIGDGSQVEVMVPVDAAACFFRLVISE